MQYYTRHIEIFQEVFQGSDRSQKAIAANAKISESKLSRFLKGGKDIPAGDFFKLLASLPEGDQREFWEKFKNEAQGETILKAIDTLSNEEAAAVLRSLADRLQMASLSMIGLLNKD